MNDNAIAPSDAPGARDEHAPPLIIPIIDYGGQGGLGHKELFDPTVPVVMQAHSSHAYTDDTFIQVYWDDIAVQGFVIGPRPWPDVLGLQVLPAHIREPQGETWYTAYDPLSGHLLSSPRRTVRIKLTVPGDPDPDNSTPTINEYLAAPQGVPERIDEPRELTLSVAPWPNMHEGDVLTLYWGGSRHRLRNPPLPADQVNRPQTLVVDSATQLAAGADRNLTINYDIRDVVGNWSLYSMPASCDVRIGLPAAPIVLEADRFTGELALEELGDADVHVQIPAYGDIALQDTVTLHWQGEAQGVPVIPTLPPQPVTDTQLPPVFSVPNAAVAAIAEGSARVYYEVSGAQAPLRTSHDTTVHVRDYPLALRYPTIDKLSQGQLDPLQVRDGVTVRFAYAHMSGNDLISLNWKGSDTVAVPAVQPGRPEGWVSFNIGPVHVARAMGKLATLFVTVIRHGQASTSEGLAFRILGLPEHETSEVRAPQILQAPDDHTLDIGQLTGDADLVVRPWPFMAVGQLIWLRLEGTLADDTPYQWLHPQWQGQPIASTTEQATQVPLSELRRLKDGTDLSLVCEVSFDDGATRIALPLRVLSLVVADATSGYESLEAWPARTLGVDERVQLGHGLSVTAGGAPATLGATDAPFPAFGDKVLRSAVTGRLRLDFGGQIRRLNLSHVNAQSGHNQLRLYNRDGVVLKLLSLDSGATIVMQDIVLEHACAWCELTTTDNLMGIYLDNLLWNATPAQDDPVPGEGGATRVSISQVSDGAGNAVPDGATTSATTLRIQGSGPAHAVLRLYDHDRLVTTASVTGERAWSVQLQGLQPGRYVYSARAPDGSVSGDRFVIVAAVLTIDTLPMRLDGLAIHAPEHWIRSNKDSAGNVAVRQATGGRPPYTYSSSDASIASVDTDGKVTGLRNGPAVISVLDSANSQVSYRVEVSNVWRLVINEGPVNSAQANAWIDSLEGKRLGLDPCLKLDERYVKPWPIDRHYWLCVPASGGGSGTNTYYFFNYVSQVMGLAAPDNEAITGAWCLRPA